MELLKLNHKLARKCHPSKQSLFQGTILDRGIGEQEFKEVFDWLYGPIVITLYSGSHYAMKAHYMEVWERARNELAHMGPPSSFTDHCDLIQKPCIEIVDEHDVAVTKPVDLVAEQFASQTDARTFRRFLEFQIDPANGEKFPKQQTMSETVAWIDVVIRVHHELRLRAEAKFAMSKG